MNNEQRKKTTRTLVQTRGCDVILKVHKYFEEEKDRCKTLIQKLTGMQVQDTDISVPLEIYTEILQYFKSAFQVQQRVVNATGISKNTLIRIRVEGPSINNDVKKRPRGKIKYLNQDQFEKFNKMILATVYKQDFNFKTLFSLVKRDLNFTGSLATLRKIVWDMGYHWQKKPGATYVTFLEKVPCSSTEIGRVLEHTDSKRSSSTIETKNNDKQTMEYDHQGDIDMLQQCDDFEMLESEDIEQSKKIEICVEPHMPQSIPHHLHDHPIITKLENAGAWGSNHRKVVIVKSKQKKKDASLKEVVHLMENTDGSVNYNKNAMLRQLLSEGTSSSCADVQCLAPNPTTEIYLKQEYLDTEDCN